MNGLVGRKLGRYEIVGLIGKGGMGEVYRARDTELGREVAVKVLPERTAGNEERLERFRREARAVAQLSHPNILDIHDFGIEDGVTYAVTERLEGSDLKERLNRRSLPLSIVLRIGRAVAEGLAAAHSKGIVHRDVKPANIFVTTTGQVKILDFGIASLRGEGVAGPLETETATDTLTMIGQVVGTASYMSPEQVAGRQVDGRSDIFSLGCVLYEMLTGRRAFGGGTPQETMIAIASRDPSPIADSRPDVPPALALVIKRCLEKEPAERFESARDVAFAMEAITESQKATPLTGASRDRLRARHRRAALAAFGAVVTAGVVVSGWQLWGGRSTLPARKHLAVMRFKAPGEDPQARQLGDGLTVLVSRGLGLLEQQTRGDLWVVPYPLAAEPRVRSIEGMRDKYTITLAVTGRLQRVGDRLRVTLALVEASGGRVLRSTVIEDGLGNPSSFQEAPLRRLAEMLGEELTKETVDGLREGATTVTSALEPYLRGIGLSTWGDGEVEGEEGLRQLEVACAADPMFARARVALARTCVEMSERSDDASWLRRAVVEAEKAIRQSPSSEAYRALAAVRKAGGELDEAVGALQAATLLAPADAEAHLELGRALQEMRRFEDAERSLQRAVYLRPGFFLGHFWLGQLYLAQGRYEAAAVEFRRVIEAAPRYTGGYNNLGSVYFFLGRSEEARSLYEQSLEIEPTGNYYAYSNLGTLYFESSRFADAAATFERALEIRSDDYRVWGNLGHSYASGAEPGRAEKPFRQAISLAEERRQKLPADDPELLTFLAGYYAAVGERERAAGVLALAVACSPVEPRIIADIAEAFEDVGDRDRALEWVDRAFGAGVAPARFESRPALRDLVSDERYRGLTAQRLDNS